MTGRVIRGSSGAGEYELPGLLPIVDRPAHVVPDLRLYLPLIDQARGGAREDEVWVHRCGGLGRLVDVQQHLARGSLSRRLGLPTGLWPLDQDGTAGFQPLIQLLVNDALYIDPVVHRHDCRTLGGTNAKNSAARCKAFQGHDPKNA